MSSDVHLSGRTSSSGKASGSGKGSYDVGGSYDGYYGDDNGEWWDGENSYPAYDGELFDDYPVYSQATEGGSSEWDGLEIDMYAMVFTLDDSLEPQELYNGFEFDEKKFVFVLGEEDIDEQSPAAWKARPLKIHPEPPPRTEKKEQVAASPTPVGTTPSDGGNQLPQPPAPGSESPKIVISNSQLETLKQKMQELKRGKATPKALPLAQQQQEEPPPPVGDPPRTQLQKSPLATVVRQCPAKHALESFQTPDVGWWCSVCKKPQAKGVTFFGCRRCDYDECEGCARAQAKPVKKIVKTSSGTHSERSSTSVKATQASPVPAAQVSRESPRSPPHQSPRQSPRASPLRASSPPATRRAPARREKASPAPVVQVRRASPRNSPVSSPRGSPRQSPAPREAESPPPPRRPASRREKAGLKRRTSGGSVGATGPTTPNSQVSLASRVYERSPSPPSSSPDREPSAKRRTVNSVAPWNAVTSVVAAADEGRGTAIRRATVRSSPRGSPNDNLLQRVLRAHSGREVPKRTLSMGSTPDRQKDEPRAMLLPSAHKEATSSPERSVTDTPGSMGPAATLKPPPSREVGAVRAPPVQGIRKALEQQVDGRKSRRV